MYGKHTNIILALLCFGSLITPLTVRAHDAALPKRELLLLQDIPIVITAARKEQSITEAPSNITMITAEQIRDSGARTLAEVLTLLPGIAINTHRKGFERIWIRGVVGGYNDKTLLLVDGYPWRELVYGQHSIDEQLPITDIKRVEVVRGPGSALYGANAFAGVINVITKDAEDVDGAEFGIGAGSWDTRSHHFLCGKESEHKGVVFAAHYYDTEGDEHERDRDGELTTKRDPNELVDLSLKASLYDFTLAIRHGRYNTEYLNYEDDRWLKWDSKHYLLQLGWKHSFGERLKLATRGYYNLFDYPREKRKFKEDYLDTLEDTEEKTQVIGAGIQAEYELLQNNSVVIGIDYEKEKAIEITETRYKIAHEKPPLEINRWTEPSQPTNSNWALFVEDIWDVTPWMSLIAGVRRDEHEQYGGQISPRGGVVLSPTNDLAAKILYGKAFRAPSYRELYVIEDEHEEDGNPNLKPEYIETMEVDLDYQPLPQLRVCIGIFQNDIENFIDVRPGDVMYANYGKHRIQGIEPELRVNWRDYVSAFINYTWLFNTEDQDGNKVSDIAEKMANLGVNVRAWEHLNINCALNHVGRRNRAPEYQEDVASENRRDNLGSYERVNIVLTTRSLPVEISAGVYNLFDVQSFNPSHGRADYDVEHPDRSFLVKIVKRFP